MEFRKPLVSIIVTCYNHAHYLPFCIESIQRGKFKDFEIIIINDASTDNSLEVAKKYASNDKRIVIINNKKNLGCIGAANVGCGAAEVLNDNLNSLLVNPKSPIEISKKIEVLIKNKMFYLNLSKNGRLFVEKNISWEIYGENMLNVFINCNK